MKHLKYLFLFLGAVILTALLLLLLIVLTPLACVCAVSYALYSCYKEYLGYKVRLEKVAIKKQILSKQNRI